MAFELVKAMRADGLDGSEDCRPLGRWALAETIEGRMAESIDAWLDGQCHAASGLRSAWRPGSQGG